MVEVNKEREVKQKQEKEMRKKQNVQKAK